MKLRLSQTILINTNQEYTSFYTTVRNIKEGVGQHSCYNEGVRKAFAKMLEECSMGILGSFNGFQIQLTVVN